MNKLILLLSLCTLIGCRSVENDPSTVDKKPLDVEQNMDRTVKPGDDFFMYCNGAWWNKTDLGIDSFVGFVMDANNASQTRVNNLNSEPIKKFWDDAKNVDRTAVAATAFLKENLKLVQNISTSDQAQDAIVNMMLAGYSNLIYLKPSARKGKRTIVLSSPPSAMDFEWSRVSLEKLGVSDAGQRVSPAITLHTSLFEDQSPLDLSIKNLEENPEVTDRIVALSQTKAVNSPLLEKVVKALGLNPDDVKIDGSMASFFTKLDQADPYQVQCLLQMYIASDYKFTSMGAYADYQIMESSAPSFDNALNMFKKQKMLYMYANAYAKQYVTADRKAKMTAYCQELRLALAHRIEQLEWMSSTTKVAAKEKLDAMILNVGYPDKWIESALLPLTGASTLENMYVFNKSMLNLAKEVAGKPIAETSFSLSLAMLEIELVNAMYDPFENSITIFPAWMLEPLYDENLSDAHNYAIFSVMGHEITHGFDGKGAKFDKFGDKKNWWTVSDLMEFKARQQKLVECYNLLEIMPNELPGVTANGQHTLEENIADIGGAVLAYQAYTARLISEGYKDEELKKQQQKFFLALSNLYRNKYTAAHASTMLVEDVHSLSKERVNGVAMNIDEWYTLFNVQWGDKLFLKPERRANIW